jgi:hypothetical protein
MYNKVVLRLNYKTVGIKARVVVIGIFFEKIKRVHRNIGIQKHSETL